VSLTKLAELTEKAGRRSEAFDLAEASLTIEKRRAPLDPTNATWCSDVKVSKALVARLRKRGRAGGRPQGKSPSGR